MAYFKYGILLLVSLLFMALGILVLVASYRLDDPFSFILSFFAANFIILISAALSLGFVLRMARLRQSDGNQKRPPSEIQ